MSNKCCCRECAIFVDDFDNSAGTVLDSNWDEVSGSWEYTGPGLRENSGVAGGLAICEIETATEEQSIIMGAVRDHVDIVGVVCNYLNSENYFYAEIEGTVTQTLVRLFRVAGGVATPLHANTIAPPAGVNEGFSVCLSHTSFTVSVGQGLVYVCLDEIASPLHTGGKKAGLRNGGTSTIDYDEFVLENYSGLDGIFDDSKCCDKQCECVSGAERFCIPNELTLTFVTTGGCSGQLSGVTIDLVWQPIAERWQSTGNNPSCANLDGGADMTWGLFCNQSNCFGPPVTATFRLISWQGSDICDTVVDGCLDADDEQSSFTCDPLSIIFPTHPFSAVLPPDPEDCGCCDQLQDGSWHAVITA